MIATISKWGNSLALRIPTAFAREIDVREGVSVDIAVFDGALVVRPVVELPEIELDELLSRITDENRHGEMATGQSVGNEF